MSATPDSTFTNPEQRIADLERQLAECRAERDERTTERDEALAREVAVAEVLGVINGSPGDLAPVFKTILEKAHTLCGATYGGLALYDGDYFQVVATHGYSDAMAEIGRKPFRGNANHRRLVSGERYVHIPDVQALIADPNDTIRQATQDAGFRTVLLVPLRKNGTLLGHFSTSRSEVRPFSDGEITLLEKFAAQAVIAMENAAADRDARGVGAADRHHRSA